MTTREYLLLGKPVTVSWTDGETRMRANGILERAVTGLERCFVEFADGRQFDMDTPGFDLAPDPTATSPEAVQP